MPDFAIKPSDPKVLQVAAAPILGKIAGAVGNYNAHIAAYPDVDWPAVAADFVQRLGLEWNPLVTQVIVVHCCCVKNTGECCAAAGPRVKSAGHTGVCIFCCC